MPRRITLLQGWSLLAVLGVSILAILVVIAMGLALSASAQGPSLSISKTASEINVHPNEVVTYTITFTNTGTVSASVVMTDIIPFGVHYVSGSATGGATYSDGRVTWSGTMNPGQIVVITFQVLVVEPETLGPLPILNTACASDGTGEICSSITIYSSWYKMFLPIIMKNYAPGPPWPWYIP